MSSDNYIKIKAQKGVKLDLDAFNKLQEGMMEELCLDNNDDDPEERTEYPFARMNRGKLQLFDGGYDSLWEWGKEINIFGNSHQGILKELADAMTAGSVSILICPDGQDENFYEIYPGKVKKVF
ncbi:hypothetical protein CMI47_11030 [Candidatus Pacearchaeota archaeon]|nr:hypothetical protein [Candidatus Pacearchaeota archaeon]